MSCNLRFSQNVDAVPPRCGLALFKGQCMALRASWKGLLVLARLGCPVRLHPAAIRADRLGFQALNRATLNRVQMRPHDPQTGKEIVRDEVARGYEAEPGHFVLIEDRELGDIQIESSRNLILERFLVPGSLDITYIDAPYFLLPDGRAADAAFGVIREAMRRRGVIGITRIVLNGRERAAIVEARGKGMMLTTLRAAHEVRGEEPYFADIDDGSLDPAMIELAERVMAQLPNAFDPRRDFRDRYQEALFHFVQAKRRGEKPASSLPSTPREVIDLRKALEVSIAAADAAKPPMPSRRPTARRTVQKPA
jgi:DNA end-binding protein Ku